MNKLGTNYKENLNKLKLLNQNKSLSLFSLIYRQTIINTFALSVKSHSLILSDKLTNGIEGMKIYFSAPWLHFEKTFSK